MPRARKPKIEYYWTDVLTGRRHIEEPKVNWRLVGANGEVMCQSTQGFRDKTDARRGVESVAEKLGGYLEWQLAHGTIREVGPGKKPA